MKSWIWLIAMSLVNMGMGNANAASEEIEINVDAVLAPSQGFDDNDRIQIVLHGMLPNACYVLGEPKVDHDSVSKKMRLRQFATRKSEGVCAQGENLPPHLAMAVPFTTELSVGQLPAGNYDFEYQKSESGFGIRSMNVAKATMPGIDSLPYAAVSSIAATDAIAAGTEAETVISGVLNSSCVELNPDVKVEKVNDVFVVLPTITVKDGVFCQVRQKFKQLTCKAMVHRLDFIRKARQLPSLSSQHITIRKIPELAELNAYSLQQPSK